MSYTKVLAAVMMLLVASSGQASRLTVAATKNVLLYNVVVSETGQKSVTATVGPLTMSGTGYSVQRGATPVRAPGALGNIPAPQFPTGTSSLYETDAKNLATSALRSAYPNIRTSVQAWLKANGVSQAWVSYSQRIDVNVAIDTQKAQGKLWWFLVKSYNPPTPVIEKRTISWSAFIGVNGDGVMPDPKFFKDSGVRILQMKYISRTTDPNVVTEQYPGAGELSWRTVDETYTPLTDWTVVDTMGAFDLPQPDGVEIDQDLMVKCLIDNTRTTQVWAAPSAGSDVIQCSTEFPDALSLMSQLGAQTAVLDYVRSIEPVYCRQDDAPCLAGTADPNPELLPNPDLEYIPSTAYSFDKREVTGSGCAVTGYHNVGSFGAKLSLATDRFLVLPTGQYSPVTRTKSTQVMDPRPFDWTIVPPAELASPALLDNYVISPATGDQLLPVTQVPNIQHLAALDAGGLTGIHHVNGAQFDTSGRQIGLALTCEPGTPGNPAQIKFSYGWADASGGVYGAPAAFTVGAPDTQPVSTKLDGAGANLTADVAYDGGNRIYFGSRFAAAAWDQFGGWTTAPELQSNCSGVGIEAPIAGSGEGLKCTPSYYPGDGIPCADGYSTAAGDPSPGTCYRTAPSLFWIEF